MAHKAYTYNLHIGKRRGAEAVHYITDFLTKAGFFVIGYSDKVSDNFMGVLVLGHTLGTASLTIDCSCEAGSIIHFFTMSEELKQHFIDECAKIIV